MQKTLEVWVCNIPKAKAKRPIFLSVDHVPHCWYIERHDSRFFACATTVRAVAVGGGVLHLFRSVCSNGELLAFGSSPNKLTSCQPNVKAGFCLSCWDEVWVNHRCQGNVQRLPLQMHRTQNVAFPWKQTTEKHIYACMHMVVL